VRAARTTFRFQEREANRKRTGSRRQNPFRELSRAMREKWRRELVTSVLRPPEQLGEPATGRAVPDISENRLKNSGSTTPEWEQDAKRIVVMGSYPETVFDVVVYKGTCQTTGPPTQPVTSSVSMYFVSFFQLALRNTEDKTTCVVIRFPLLGSVVPAGLDHNVVTVSNEAVRRRPEPAADLGT
jgi:hypothetical protein